MKPVRRRIRRHFGLTAKQVAVRSKRPWYFQWGIALLFVAVGYSIGYWKFVDGGEYIREKLKQSTVENQNLQSKLIQLERQLQIEQSAQIKLVKDLNFIQDENIHLKENLLFYKNIVINKPPPNR